MRPLNGKTALVTGGSRGIGRAIVKRLVSDGASVMFSFLENETAAQKVVREVTDAGGQAFAVRADQGRIEDLQHLFAQAEERLNGLDIVVCNAADSTATAITDVTEDIYDRLMAVNAKGPFFIIQYAGRRLRDGGRIITISTLNTVFHPAGGALYTGGKGALEHFTVVAAIEFGGRGITANIVSPGATDTDLLRGSNPAETFDDDMAQDVAQTALKRLGQPHDIARVAAFLAGPDSGWITGQNLSVNGGFLP
jgi:3-oxoacyl-[acyl-carrier protein] reductase